MYGVSPSDLATGFMEPALLTQTALRDCDRSTVLVLCRYWPKTRARGTPLQVILGGRQLRRRVTTLVTTPQLLSSVPGATGEALAARATNKLSSSRSRAGEPLPRD